MDTAPDRGLVCACRASRDADAGKKRGRDDQRIELSLGELRRLLQGLREPEEQREKRLWWSRFRRMHQAVAKRCHQVRRARQAPLPSSTNPVPIPVLGLPSLTEARCKQLKPVWPPQKPHTRVP